MDVLLFMTLNLYVEIQIYDVAKAFDKMWFKESMNGLYEAGVIDDKFSLLCELNKTSKIFIRTPVGNSEKFEINDNVMQGGVWGPLQCSIEIDQIGKECMEKGEKLYKYKDCVSVSSLAMIDDLAGISKCGCDSIVLNSYINTKIKSKKLTCGSEKYYIFIETRPRVNKLHR